MATEGYADDGDSANALITDATVTSVVRVPGWARAWIRAADHAAALAGTGAATWTNQGPETPPTGAHWNPANVPAGAGNLYELVSLRTPTAGSNSAWTLGTWTAFQITSTNTQYSVDGSSAWHAVRAQADRYERHRVAGGAWGPAIPLYAGDELVWTQILQQTIVQQTTRWLPAAAWTLPASISFHSFSFMRFRLETQRVSDNHPIYTADKIIRPARFLAAHDYAQRAATGLANIPARFINSLRMDARGLSVLLGHPALGIGADGDGTDVGLELMWYRPAGLGSASDAGYLRLLYVRNLNVRHLLTIEAL